MLDSHCHLADEAFEGDLDDVIARARQAGLDRALCILSAGDEGEALRAKRVRDRWPEVWFAAGVHPHNAGQVDGAAAGVNAVRSSAAMFGTCAVGEIGLDYHYDFSPRDVQREVFAAQVELAVELGRPVIIHTREATDDTFAVLREAGGGRATGVFHCFTGDSVMARRALDIGFHLSFAGIVTFPKATELREAARLVPDDRLLVETDCPYLAPVPFRGKRNEPSFVGRVLDVLAETRGAAREALGVAIDGNFARLFGPNRAGRMA